MKVTKQMHRKELQKGYSTMKLLSRVLMTRAGVRLLNFNSARSKGKEIEGLHCEERYITSQRGDATTRVRIFRPLNCTEPIPGMLYIHGGGLLLGNPEDYLDIIKRYIEAKPCVIVAPDYRKALDAPYPAAFNDCYDTLLWMNEHVRDLNIIPDKLIVAGHSAGGGIASAVTMKATDTRDVKIAFHIPIYPMLDDRQGTESAMNNNSAGWNSRSNSMGWSAYLRELIAAGKPIPSYAAPARATDYSKLPPAITFVGNLEPFRDETIAYVNNLRQAKVPVTFRIFEGVYHAFEVLSPKLEVSKDAWKFLLSSYSGYVDQYIYNDCK